VADQTRVDEDKVREASQKHDTMREKMRDDLKQLQNRVQVTLQSSESDQTKALANVYDEWFRKVDSLIIEKCGEMSKNMRTTADEQAAADAQNSSQMNAFLS
jgi:hypothetical protein